MKNKILSSQYRLDIEKFIIEHIKDMSFEQIAIEITKKFNEIFTPGEVQDYYDNYISQGKSAVGQIVEAAKDVANIEFDFDKDLQNITARFSYDVLSKEFELIYDRIRELYAYAKLNPDNGSYDKRIVAYLERANQLRGFIIKDSFKELKKAVISDVGKKIIIAAISTFIVYIPDDKKEEAKNKFLNAISGIIKSQFEEPEDIKNIREEYGKKT